MTQGIERSLNLLPLEEALKQAGFEPPEQPDPAIPVEEEEPLTEEVLDAMELALTKTKEIDAAMDLTGMDHATAMDKIHVETLKHSRDLMDLGFNVDIRSARGIFEVATTMYRNSMDAKNMKRDAQLKAMKLALDERKLALQEEQIRGKSQDNIIEGEGFIVADRNDLLKKMLAQMKPKSSTK